MKPFGSKSPLLQWLCPNLCAAILLLTLPAWAQQQQPLLTHHVREAVVTGQAPMIGSLPLTQSMPLILVLPLRNQAALDAFLQELYDPSSRSYRQFLTVEQFTAKFGPTQEDYDTVRSFAEANGFTIVGTSRNRLNLEVTGSVASIEKAFHLTLGVYQHPTENRSFFAPDREPTIDMAVQLWHIAGLDNYSTPKSALRHRQSKGGSNATTGSGPSASFLGSDMRAAYYGGTLTGSGQSLGLFELLGTDLADLSTYYTNVHQTNSVPITLKSVDTQSTSCLASAGCDDTEQTLDMTQALGMAPGLSSLVMYIGTGGLSGQTVDDTGIFNAMATASPLNAQLSSSWYWNPADPTTDNPYFEEFAAQGQNLFDAAGDDEDWQISGSIWPSDNAYLTSVGGTDLDTASAGGAWASETAWSDTGGGISPNDIPIPSWQTATATGCSTCSKTYRNGPDVSANANFTFYVCADQTTCTANEYGGTSFAAPMWAGYLALANQQAVADGLHSLGFINPSLYQIGLSSSYDTDFHDITSGSNGYSATTGFDLATGWGSPNGGNLITALLRPYIASLTPSSLTTQVSSGYVTILGSNLDNASGTTSTTISGTGITSTTSYVSSNQINVYYTLAANATLGSRTVTVTNNAGSGTASLTITNVTAPPPAINSGGIAPSSITQGSSGYTSIYGEDLSNTAGTTTTTISGTGVTWTASYISATQINVAYTVASNAPTGSRTVTVTTTSGSSTVPITVTP
jgi:subtilase family serine protease